ncbi:MAG: hypothetical protein PHD21_07555 [Flavobacteriales bacterium]|nr:hypothetical protein [Flavobacteriales bacterium]
MLNLILILLVIGCVVYLIKSKKISHDAYSAQNTKADAFLKDEKYSDAADVYLSILEKEYEKDVVNASLITHYTDIVIPLLHRCGRLEDERCVLHMGIAKCVMHTFGGSWNKWQKRLEWLDNKDKKC